MSNNKNNADAAAVKKTGYGVSNSLVNYYLVLMFTLFPLYFTEKYSNIRHDKLNFYLVASVMVILSVGVAALIGFFEKKRAGDLGEKKWYELLSVPDIAFASLILLYIISTVFSAAPLEAFSGESGRNNGLLIFIFYFLIYLIISRFYFEKEYVYIALAVGSIATHLLCILNFYYVDIFTVFGYDKGIYYGYDANTIKDFTSTIGNKNIMSAFCCLTIPILAMLYMNSSKKYIKYLYLAGSGIGFASMLCADSESGLLGFVPVMALILLFYSRNLVMIRKFFAVILSMLVSAKLLFFVRPLLGGAQKGFGTMQSIFIDAGISYVPIVITALIVAGLFLVEYKNIEVNIPKLVPYALIGVYALAFALIAGLFVRYSFIDTHSKLGGIMTFFRFNEKWGTHRGFIWIKAVEIFKNGGFKNMIIGSGPDTFYSMFVPYFGELASKFGNGSTNCAHNEFLNYLVTTGILGLGAYMTLFISAIVRAVKYAKKNPMTVVFIAPVVCYLFQSVVNIANPEVTPLLFIFLALSEAMSRKAVNS